MCNIKAYLFDTLLQYWIRRLASTPPEKMEEWYGKDPLELKSSVELLALRETMRHSAPLVNNIWRFRELCKNTSWLLGASQEAMTEVNAGGVKSFRIQWPDITPNEKRGILLYFHGGGYVAGHASGYSGFLGRLSKDTRIPCLSVDYRLVMKGETTVKDAIDDCLTAYRYLLSDGYSPQDIILAGDSAGAGLVVSLLQRLQGLGEAMPLCGVCISPFVDSSFSGESSVNNMIDQVINPGLISSVRAYLAESHDGEKDLKTTPVSPLFGAFAGLPPLFVSVSTTEALYNDSTRLTEKARGAGVDVTLRVMEGYGYHIEPCFCHIYPEANKAKDAICEYINRALVGRK